MLGNYILYYITLLPKYIYSIASQLLGNLNYLILHVVTDIYLTFGIDTLLKFNYSNGFKQTFKVTKFA
jgi:hypothetical protein